MKNVLIAFSGTLDQLLERIVYYDGGCLGMDL